MVGQTLNNTTHKPYARGFTIVELLIVIIVIGILATLVLVAYSNIQKSAADAVVQGSMTNNGKALALYTESNGIPSLATVQANSAVNVKFPGNNNIRLATYCSTDTSFALSAMSSSGKIFYIKRNGVVTNNDSLSMANPCSTIGLVNNDGSAAIAGYLGVSSTACTTEGGTCTFSGTRTVLYGANTSYNYRTGLSGSVVCNNTTFGDPISGVAKACYIASYD